MCSVVSDFCEPMDYSPPWNVPGKEAGVGCYFLLQGIFLTQGLSPALQVNSLPLHHLGSSIYVK